MKMKRKMSMLLTVLLCVLMTAGVLPMSAFAEAQVSSNTSGRTYDISKSKTASPLDTGTWTSDITLSLPADEYNGDLGVVFVLDGSTSTDAYNLAASAASMLGNLAEYQNANIKAGLVIFGGSTPLLYSSDYLLSLTDENLTKLTEAIKDGSYDGMEGRSGSNLQAGVEEARQMLDKDSTLSDTDKYMILLTDGGARMWLNDKDEPMSQAFIQYNSSGISWGSNQDFASRYIEEVNKKPLRSFDVVWQAGNSDSDFTKYAMSQEESRQASAVKKAASWNTVCLDEDGTYYTSLEAATYHAATSIIKASESSHVIWVDYPYHGGAYEEYTDSFKTWLSDKGYITRYDSQDQKPEEVFSEVEDQLTYLLDSGSYVTDYMGYVKNDYNFDFVNDASKIYITVNDKKLEAVQLDENVYGFGKNDSDSYDYVLTYSPAEDGQEHFKWDINVPISRFSHLKLHYSVKLTNPKTEAGTYGIYDGNGSKGYTSLYTNNSATLYPKHTHAEKVGPGEDFPKPTVSYDVKTTNKSNNKNTNTTTTVSDKDEPTSTPDTGDESNVFLWLALLIVSSGAAALVTFFNKSTTRSK